MTRKKLTDSEIRELAKKYLKGTSSAEENAMLHEWYDTVNPGRTETVQVDAPTSSEEIGEEIFAGLQQRIQQEKGRVLDLPRRSVQWWHAAAAILLLLSGVAVYHSLSSRNKKDQFSYAARTPQGVGDMKTDVVRILHRVILDGPFIVQVSDDRDGFPRFLPCGGNSLVGRQITHKADEGRYSYGNCHQYNDLYLFHNNGQS